MPSTSGGGGPKRRPLPNSGGGSNGNSNGGNNESPSSVRRSTLRQIAEEPILQYSNLSNLCPLDRYYSISNKLLEAFTSSFESAELDEAYVYGVRYVNFVLKVLPHHNYYNLIQNKSKKKESLQNGTHVMDALEEIKTLMDEEEILKERERTAKLRQLPLEERLKILQSSSKAVVAEQQQQEQQRRRQQQEEEEQRLRLKFQQQQLCRKVPPPPPPPPIMGGSNNLLPPPPPIPPPPTTAPPSSSAPAVVTPEPSEEENFLKYLFITIQMDSDDSIFSNNGSKDDDSSSLDYLAKTGRALNESQDLLLKHGRQSSEDDDDETSNNSKSFSHGNNSADDSDPVAPAYSVQETIRNMKLIISKTKTSDGSGTNKSISNGSSCSPEDVCSDMSMERLQKIYAAVYRQWLYMPINYIDVSSQGSQSQIEVTSSNNQHQIDIQPLKTFQGRFDNSVNGCTVIAPLCVAKHLYGKSQRNILNRDIEGVIDRDCPPILSKIRTKLGLPKHALIIPSDVHDYLLDHKILRQEDFVGACGGNIFDYNHLSELLKMLCYGNAEGASQSWIPNKDKKVGVALFFHEHVISIVKCIDKESSSSTTTVTFDLIDSLPSGQGTATRTKCYTIQALEVLLRNYASSKLTPADKHFINHNVWSDELCDFDPRVFQAFVWSCTKV